MVSLSCNNMRQNLYSNFMNSFVTISHLFDLNACQSPRVDEEFKSIWVIITYLPYNVKHCSLFFFIRSFFHLLSYLRRLIHKSKIFLVYGNFKFPSYIVFYCGSWVLLNPLCDTKMCYMLIVSNSKLSCKQSYSICSLRLF